MTDLLSNNVQYDIYKFNGETFTLINKKKTNIINDININININNDDDINNNDDNINNDNDNDNNNIIFTECNEFYKTVSNSLRQCAKMFYKLIINNIIYRVEIRWKGSFTASPQFMCYLI